jgi:hypothetical protein
MASVPHKNGWQGAEVIGDLSPDATQRVLYQAQWRVGGARDPLLKYRSTAETVIKDFCFSVRILEIRVRLFLRQ